MENLAVLHQNEANEPEPDVRILLADDDPRLRSLLASWARDAVEGIAVLEAEDGPEAIQLGLQQRPQVAVLDVEMPRLGGIEAAVTLRELRPGLRLALQSGDPAAYRERAREEGLPLFDKAELDRALAWLQAQVHSLAEARSPGEPARLGFVCASCGYGVIRSAPPERCPMCQEEDCWSNAASRTPHVPAAGRS